MLSACGGGGGGSSTSTTTPTTPPAPTTPPPNFSNPVTVNPGDPIPPNTTMPVLLTGNAIESVFGGPNQFEPFGAPIPATLITSENTSGDPNAGPDAIKLIANGETIEVGLRAAGVSSDITFDGTSFNITNDDGAFIIQPFAYNENPLEYATYGGWANTSNATTNPNASEKIRFGVFGSPTPETSMPSTDASYSGESIGLVSTDRPQVGFTTSDIAVTTSGNFSNVSVTSTNTKFSNLTSRNEIIRPQNLDFQASGAVTGNGFSLTNATTSTNFDLKGRVDGNFYGPNAEEVGGTFGLSNGNKIYGGSFGAKQ